MEQWVRAFTLIAKYTTDAGHVAAEHDVIFISGFGEHEMELAELMVDDEGVSDAAKLEAMGWTIGEYDCLSKFV